MERLPPTDEHHLGWVLGDDMSTVLCAVRWWDTTSHTQKLDLAPHIFKKANLAIRRKGSGIRKPNLTS